MFSLSLATKVVLIFLIFSHMYAYTCPSVYVNVEVISVIQTKGLYENARQYMVMFRYL